MSDHPDAALSIPACDLKAPVCVWSSTGSQCRNKNPDWLLLRRYQGRRPSTCSVLLGSAVLCAPAAGCLRARGCSSADGSGQSTASGIKHRGRDYFKCQHNVMSCVRRSNVQTVLSGEQLIDQLRFVLLWPLRWAETSSSWTDFGFCARMSTTDDWMTWSEIAIWNELRVMCCYLAVNFADWFCQPHNRSGWTIDETGHHGCQRGAVLMRNSCCCCHEPEPNWWK